MHRPTEKFIVHQIYLASIGWVECHASEKATPKTPRRRLAVMPDYEIVAKRWINGDGDTYHSVRLYDVREGDYKVVGIRLFTYGYGDHWQTTAVDLLQEMLPEIFPKTARASGHAGIYLRDECNIACTVSDVKRKGDM